MKPIFLAWCIAPVLLSVDVHAAPIIATKDVVEVCEVGFGLNGTAESSARKATCIAYLDAVIATALQIGTLASPDGKRRFFCLPDDIAYPDLAKNFVRFAKKNERYETRAAASVVLAAFSDIYACKK
jgi:hypothetical protein